MMVMPALLNSDATERKLYTDNQRSGLDHNPDNHCFSKTSTNGKNT